MTNTETRQPNVFYRVSEICFVGSYISLQVELHDLTLMFSRTSRNSNEVWVLTAPSPRTGVEFPLGTATLMQPEAEGEGPYFLGRIEDPSGLNVPFKIAPVDPSDPDSPWAIRYNPPMSTNNSARPQQGGYPHPQRRGFGQQRPTTLGPSTGAGGFTQSGFGRPSGHGFNGTAPNGIAGHGSTTDDDTIPY